MNRPLAAALLGFLTLPGCAAQRVDAPSLLPRPIEQVGFDEPEVTPVEVAPDPALDAAIADARTRLAAAADAFALAATRATNLVAAAKGAGVGSDPWLDAQIALADLDDDRATTLAIAADLDQRASDRGVAGNPDYPALSALRAAAQIQVDEQTRRIAALTAQLPGA